MTASTYLLAGQASELERLKLQSGCGSPPVAGFSSRSATGVARGPSTSAAG
jgi:hypothetical protein